MSMIKRIISTVTSATLIGSCMIAFPVYADDSESAVIYRTSCEGTNEDGNCNFVYTLKARDNGNIHIEVQGKDYTGSSVNVVKTIGNLIFNDSMIASIDEIGANGKSCSQLSFSGGSCRDITSYDESNIVYTVSCPSYTHDTMGKTIATYDLYVKEPYLTTNQTINLFGTEVEIPFGEPPIDKDAKIEKYENENAELRNKIKEQSEELETINAKYNEAYATIVNNEIAIAGKDEIINGLMADNKNLREEISELTKKVSELTENITELEKVIETLNDKIKMYEDRMAKMSQNAEIIMTMSDSINRCDINGDSLIDANDASIVLQTYVLLSTGTDVKKISQVVN